MLRTTAALVLPAAVLDVLASGASFLAQTTSAESPAAVTMLVAAITLAEAAGGALAGRLSGATLRGQWLLAAVGAIVVGVSSVLPSGILIAVVGLPSSALPFRCARRSCSGCRPTTREPAWRHSQARATWRARRSRCRWRVAGAIVAS